MNFVSLFSGVGGFEAGLEWSGMRCVGQVEISDYRSKILAQHWPDVKRVRDIHDVNGTEFGTVDLICGGPPCQPASMAGKRKGTADDRWLWPEVIRLVGIIKPRWVFFENPCGILSLQGGVPFDNALSALENAGYANFGEKIVPVIIGAASVEAPHERYRVWIIANLTSDRRNRRRAGAETEKGLQQRPEHAGKLSGRLEGHNQDASNGNNTRELQCERREQNERERISNGVKDVANNQEKFGNRSGRTRSRRERFANSSFHGLQGSVKPLLEKGQEPYDQFLYGRHRNWSEPWPEVATRLCRMDARIPRRMDRIAALGDSVVPQVVEEIGRAIMEAEHSQP